MSPVGFLRVKISGSERGSGRHPAGSAHNDV